MQNTPRDTAAVPLATSSSGTQGRLERGEEELVSDPVPAAHADPALGQLHGLIQQMLQQQILMNERLQRAEAERSSGTAYSARQSAGTISLGEAGPTTAVEPPPGLQASKDSFTRPLESTHNILQRGRAVPINWPPPVATPAAGLPLLPFRNLCDYLSEGLEGGTWSG